MKKFIITTLIFGLTFVSCGKSNTKKKSEVKAPQQEEKTPEVSNKEDSNKEITLHLSGNDQMQYDKKEFIVKQGQKVTLVLKHTGKMDKSVMGHNFVLLKKETNIDDFSAKAIEAKNTDYIPVSDAIIAHTKLIGGGESTSITFDAPEKGTYDFICSFPGHHGMMRGKFIVE